MEAVLKANGGPPSTCKVSLIKCLVAFLISEVSQMYKIKHVAFTNICGKMGPKKSELPLYRASLN